MTSTGVELAGQVRQRLETAGEPLRLARGPTAPGAGMFDVRGGHRVAPWLRTRRSVHGTHAWPARCPGATPARSLVRGVGRAPALRRRPGSPVAGPRSPHLVEGDTRIGQRVRQGGDGDRGLGDDQGVRRQLGRRAGQRRLRPSHRSDATPRTVDWVTSLPAGPCVPLAKGHVGGAVEQAAGDDRRRREDRDVVTELGQVECGPEAAPVAEVVEDEDPPARRRPRRRARPGSR